MNIVVALNNEIITKKIKEEFKKDNVFKYDISKKEDLIEYLSKNKDECTVITKDSLEGNIDNRLYIKQIKLASPKANVIYIVEKLTKEYKEFLFANEVFNIFEGDNINLEYIIKTIQEDKKIVYEKGESINEPAEQYIVKNNFLTKEKIAIYGASGSGKSIISSLIAKKISRDFDLKVALLDMDIQDPSIDIINNVYEEETPFSKIVESVDNLVNTEGIISKYMIKDSNNKNLWYITNNCSLFDCHNKLSNKYYEKLYNSVYNKCDFTFIDLPSSPFLDVVPYTLNVASKILFVVNANYMSVRQAIKYINLITKLWDNEECKIYIIVNKMQNNSLDIKQIEALFNGYKVIATIDYYKEIEGYINGGIPNLELDIDLSGLYKVLGLKEKHKKGILKRFQMVGKLSGN